MYCIALCLTRDILFAIKYILRINHGEIINNIFYATVDKTWQRYTNAKWYLSNDRCGFWYTKLTRETLNRLYISFHDERAHTWWSAAWHVEHTKQAQKFAFMVTMSQKAPKNASPGENGSEVYTFSDLILRPIKYALFNLRELRYKNLKILPLSFPQTWNSKNLELEGVISQWGFFNCAS